MAPASSRESSAYCRCCSTVSLPFLMERRARRSSSGICGALTSSSPALMHVLLDGEEDVLGRGREGEQRHPVIELALLDGAGGVELLLGAHHGVQRHVAEVAGEHRVAAALLHVAQIAGGQLPRPGHGGLGDALDRGELEVDELGRRLLDHASDGISQLGRPRTDGGLLRRVVLEEAVEIGRGGALDGHRLDGDGLVLGRPHGGSLLGGWTLQPATLRVNLPGVLERDGTADRRMAGDRRPGGSSPRARVRAGGCPDRNQPTRVGRRRGRWYFGCRGMTGRTGDSGSGGRLGSLRDRGRGGVAAGGRGVHRLLRGAGGCFVHFYEASVARMKRVIRLVGLTRGSWKLPEGDSVTAGARPDVLIGLCNG